MVSGNSVVLKKTIDDLTEKCQRSIELLRLCNRNQLSESVENLLDSVVVVSEEDGGGDGKESEMGRAGEKDEGLTGRLEKLSSAFDAIQKFLEEQSTSSVPGGGRASTNSSLSPPISQHSGTKGRAASATAPHSSSTSRLLKDLTEGGEAKDLTF